MTFSPEAGANGGTALTFDGTVRFERGRVVLITDDGGRRMTRSQGR